MVVSEKQKMMLNTFLRDLLKRVLALPQRTANEAPFLLLGSLTAEATLDMRILVFFRKILADPSSVLAQVCAHQLATKSLQSNSWFMATSKLLYKYNLHLVIQCSYPHLNQEPGRNWSNKP